ncbi:probable G-protein coupled receptor 63 [Patiria miniata]|uniref:G-protein coupled receptors family 1 profile domain-containing protein n=1 Tax=Patiria miniata TaxID=46514 RepID=A0A914B336_PATMI|nr:probable G-protein coupled receptor 63 [Patiria miniata]
MTDSGLVTSAISTGLWISPDSLTTEPSEIMTVGLSTIDLDASTGDLSTTTDDVNLTGTLDNATGLTTVLQNVTSSAMMSSSSWSTGEVMTTTVADSAVAVAAAVFLSIFVLIALVGNVCCLIALTHKNLEKTFVLNTFLGNICAVQLCDSVLTMPLVIGAAASGYWPYGEFMCQLSAFVLNLINVETIIALALLALDRLLAVRWPNVYSKMNRVKASLITGYAWLHGTAFTLVIVAGVITTEYLPDCYLCSVSSQTGTVYLVFFSLFCYILPLIIIVSMYVVIIKVAVDEKPTVQNFNAEVNYANRLGRRSKLWRELRQAKTVGALVILWCLFEGPYLAIQTVYLYGDSGYPSASDNVFSTPVKTGFTWMRFCYAWIVPLVVFVGVPEVREQLSSTCACRKKNMVDSGRQEILAQPGVRTSWAPSDSSNSQPSTLGRSFHVPVLFATSGGLRLQIGNKQRGNDVDKAEDFHQGFYPDPRTKYDPTKSRYPPPLTPVPQSSDEDTGGSWDIRAAVRGDSPEPGEIAQEIPQASLRKSSDPDRDRSPSTSSSFQLSLTSRELKLSRNNGTPRSPNGAPSPSPVVTPRQQAPETPPGSIPQSETNTPR